MHMSSISHAFSGTRLSTRVVILGLGCLAISRVAAAEQTAPCHGVSAVKETSVLMYPPIARAAHVEGTVLVSANFDQSGTVTTTKLVSGPLMLQQAANDFVRGLRSNADASERDCQFDISFKLMGNIAECGSREAKAASRLKVPPTEHPDVEHYTLYARVGCINTEAQTTK